jgi:putative DNA primase/helicase
MKSKLSKFGRAALTYAKRGWYVIPLQERKKEPLTAHAYRDATLDEQIIRQWWKKWPGANIGIAVGRKYGLVVVDVDGPSGRDELARLEAGFGALTPTREATSGRPHRRHLYYEYPDDVTIHRIPEVNGAKLDILVNGYVMAAPSIHPKTGEPVRWTRKVAPAPLPETIKKLSNMHWRQNITHRGAARIPDIITEGERDKTLTSIAGTMRRRNMPEKAILAGLREVNAEQVRPPLPDKDLRRIAKSIGNKPAPPFALTEPITDINLARRFAAIERNELRYCREWRKWLVWDGQYWAPDVTFEVDRRLELMIRGLLDMVIDVPDPDDRAAAFKGVNMYARHGRLKDLEERSRMQEQFIITPDKLDTDPWFLNVENGTLDLRTGELLPHDPAHLITKITHVTYNAKATAPKWEKFLREITSAPPRKGKKEPKNDEQLRAFLRYAVGYSLAGVVREHVLFFCFGGGANGKTTFLETIQALLGDYAVTIDFETLLHHSYQSSEARRDLPRLNKARFVSANETPTNARWDERTMKQLTGGDTLSGRWLYGEKFQFTPTHTLWCRANDEPTSQDMTNAFWRRMRKIPFRRKFSGTKEDTKLGDKLLAELPGILNWAIAGCLAWQKSGLPVAESVKKATADYRQEQNIFGEFLEARYVPKASYWIETAEFYQSFKEWWSDTRGNRFAPTSRAFGLGLGRQPMIHAVKRGHARTRGWKGYAPRGE